MTSKAFVKIVHYNRYSTGAAFLAKSLGISRVTGDTGQLGEKNVLINWGCTKLSPHIAQAGTILNPPGAIAKMVNKLEFFKFMEDHPLFKPRMPDWTENRATASQWVDAGHEVLGRAQLKGKGGAGIIFGSEEETFEDFLDCTLFVKYKKKKEEYRVHFFGDKLLDVQQKLLRKFDDNGTPIERDHVDFRVRNLQNGFVFARNDIKPPADVITQAKKAFGISSLDFGCVDVLYNEVEGQAYVLEINTAPGLMGTTLEKYKDAFKEKLGI